jgi:hypothetical protein
MLFEIALKICLYGILSQSGTYKGRSGNALVELIPAAWSTLRVDALINILLVVIVKTSCADVL